MYHKVNNFVYIIAVLVITSGCMPQTIKYNNQYLPPTPQQSLGAWTLTCANTSFRGLCLWDAHIFMEGRRCNPINGISAGVVYGAFIPTALLIDIISAPSDIYDTIEFYNSPPLWYLWKYQEWAKIDSHLNGDCFISMYDIEKMWNHEIYCRRYNSSVEEAKSIEYLIKITDKVKDRPLYRSLLPSVDNIIIYKNHNLFKYYSNYNDFDYQKSLSTFFEKNEFLNHKYDQNVEYILSKVDNINRPFNIQSKTFLDKLKLLKVKTPEEQEQLDFRIKQFEKYGALSYKDLLKQAKYKPDYPVLYNDIPINLIDYKVRPIVERFRKDSSRYYYLFAHIPEIPRAIAIMPTREFREYKLESSHIEYQDFYDFLEDGQLSPKPSGKYLTFPEKIVIVRLKGDYLPLQPQFKSRRLNNIYHISTKNFEFYLTKEACLNRYYFTKILGEISEKQWNELSLKAKMEIFLSRYFRLGTVKEAEKINTPYSEFTEKMQLQGSWVDNYNRLSFQHNIYKEDINDNGYVLQIIENPKEYPDFSVDFYGKKLNFGYGYVEFIKGKSEKLILLYYGAKVPEEELIKLRNL